MARKRSGTKSTEVYEELKKLIISLQIPPGQMLVEGELTERFNVSRTPVREAIIKLIQEGFLVEQSGRVYVVNLTFEDTQEIFQIRIALEGMAAQLAVQNATKELIKTLRSVNRQMENSLEKKDYSRLFHLDNHFHELIIEASGNRRMKEILSNMNLQISRIRYLTLIDPERVYETVNEHEEIVKALEAKDAKAAYDSMVKHITNVQNVVNKLGDITSIMNSEFFSSNILRSDRIGEKR